MLKTFTEEQIVHALRQAEAGNPAIEVCRKMEVAEQTFHCWKRKFAGMVVTELRSAQGAFGAISKRRTRRGEQEA